ncbi:MAG TPA: DUF4307 domain-containing protein [Asanoa sp.]
MTETHATTPAGTPVFPPGRYGRRRAPRRRRPWLMVALVAVMVIVGTAVAVRLYRSYGDPTYQPEVVTWANLSDTRVSVTFRVRVPTGGSAVCVVRARSREGVEVGSEEVRVIAAPGQRRPTITHELAVTGRAIVGEVPRCRAAG